MELLLLLPYLHICNRVHEGSSTALFISDFALSFDIRGAFLYIQLVKEVKKHPQIAKGHQP